MKKSKLKKIIRESINQLMNEQTPMQCATLESQPSWTHCCESAVQGGDHSVWTENQDCKPIMVIAQGMGLTQPQVESCCPGGFSPILGCPQCDPQVLQQIQPWVNQWNNSIVPNATNACTMICNKIGIWTNRCPSASPHHQDLLACRIATVYISDA